MKLRKYQKDAVNAILNNNKGIISAATGSGKTTMMASAIEKQSGKILVVVHTRALVYQTVERLKRETSKSVGMFFGEAHHSFKNDIIVATWQTLQIAAYIRPDYFNHIHVDECHNARGDKYSKTIKRFTPKTLHGYTATFHGNGQEKLEDLFGSVIYEIGLFQLIEMGYLSKMKIMVNVGKVGSKNYNTSKFDIINETTMENGVVEKALHFYSRNKRFNEVKKWNLLKTGSYASISAKTKSEEREKLFDTFRDEKSGLNHLLANRVLNEGIDLPITNTLVFHENIGDFRTISQRFGRGLRVWEENKNVVTQILMFIDEDKIRQKKSLEQLLGEIEYEASKRKVESIVERNSSTFKKHDEDPTDDCPVKIILIDKTSEIMDTFMGRIKHSFIKDFTLEEFVEEMRKDGITNSSQFYKVYRNYNYGVAPHSKFNLTTKQLWDKVNDKKDFTLEEFIEEIRKDGIRSRQFKKIWRNYSYGVAPENKFNLTTKQLWDKVRGYEDFTLEEFIEQMRKDGITSGGQFAKVWRNYSYGVAPQNKFNLTMKQLWNKVKEDK